MQMEDDFQTDKGQNPHTITKMALFHPDLLLDRHLNTMHLVAGDKTLTRPTIIPTATKGHPEPKAEAGVGVQLSMVAPRIRSGTMPRTSSLHATKNEKR